tara:strand:- start:238 stop:1005 length:768 start_codon:yes stop_codon:yes gene_type:complete
MQTSRDNPSVNETLIILSLVALLSSALSGLVGLGGGTILIAALFAAGLTPLEAVPLFAAVQLVSNSTRTVAYVRHVDWRAVAWFCATVIPATFVVAPFAASVDVDAVRLLLAGLILASLLPGRGGEAPLPRRPSFLLAGLLNGGLGMFVGATGLFVGRLFLRPEWRKETTIATLAVTQVLGHGLRIVAWGLVGASAFAQPRLLLAMCAAVIAGTWIGKSLNGRLSAGQFTGLFKVILVVLSTKLIFDSLRGFGWI